MREITVSNQLLNKPDIDGYLIKQIAMLFILKGQEAGTVVLKGQSTLLKQEIAKYFPTIQQEEFEAAINAGVRGEFGEYMGLNIITYNSWIKAYRAKPKYKVLNTEPVEEMSYEEYMKLEAVWIEAIKKQFFDFKETGKLYIVLASSQYKEFVERKLFEADSYKAYMDSAKRHLIEKKKAERLRSSSYKVRTLSETITRMSTGKENPDELMAIEIQAKTECIENYYRSIDKLELSAV